MMNMPDLRLEETLRTYETYASQFDEKFGTHFAQHIQPSAEMFLGMLPVGTRVLDLGAGTGNHAAFFQSRGADVLCADISPAMLARCEAKGLRTRCGDMEEMDFPAASFDGVWAFASLLHLPKEHTPRMIARLASWIVPGGVFALALKEGEGEWFEENEDYPGTRRWFSYYTEDEVRAYCEPYFSLIDSFSRIDVGGHYRWLHSFWRCPSERP